MVVLRAGEQKGLGSDLPRISVIIPVPPDGDVGPAMISLRQVRYPPEKFEIIKSEGYQPSKQRNEAAKAAEGEILAFFDNDSLVSREVMLHAVNAFQLPRAAVVGGPNLTLPSDSSFQQALGMALGSRFAHAKMAARYRPIGGRREADQQELILCNMFVKRETFLELRGFDEKLYPNEENEFLNRVKAQAQKIIYDPEMIIWRSRRKTLSKFVKQMFNYGRGRGEQLFVERFQAGGMLYLAPIVFTLYILLMLPMPYAAAKVPMLVYLGFAFTSALLAAYQTKKSYYVILLPFLYLIMHISYGLGTVRGLINGIRAGFQAEKGVSEVKVVRLKAFGEQCAE
jgi:succinoglycan biosynthesis protein ExoA